MTRFVLTLLVIVTAGYGISFAGEQRSFQVGIIATPKSGRGPMWVYLKPEIKNLNGTLKFKWYFGDGKESVERIPPPHLYEYGKCIVVLEVTDKDNKKYTASVTIDAGNPG
ncbi:MAG: hypothetical protein AB1488_08050 [Nitrospirota bacterium]